MQPNSDTTPAPKQSQSIRTFSCNESQEDIVNEFRDTCYVVLKGALDPTALKSIQAEIKRMEGQNWRVKYANKKESVREISNVYSSYSMIASILKESKALPIVKKIIGEDLLLFRDAYIEKLPNPESRFPLHQDSEFWKVSPEALVSMWIPFQDSNEINRVLNVVPGSHKHRLTHSVKLGAINLPRIVNSLLRQSAKNSDSTGAEVGFAMKLLVRFASFINSRVIPFLSRHLKAFEKFTEFFVVKDDARYWNEAVAPNLELGDIIVYHSLTLHGSRGNNSGQVRAAYIPTFMGANYTINHVPVTDAQFNFVKI